MTERLSKLEMLLQQTLAMLPNAEPEELDGWASQKTIMRQLGVGKTTLYKLRREGKITSSTIEGKGIWYRKSDFKNLLDENERNG